LHLSVAVDPKGHVRILPSWDRPGDSLKPAGRWI